HPSVPAQNLREFIALARSQPGGMNFGSGGSGTSNHLAGELLNLATGIKLVHVPYKGVNLAMNGVLAGEVQLVFIGVPVPAPHIKAGRLRALAVLARERSALLPEVPTADEAGLPNFDVTTWYGIMAPAGRRRRAPGARRVRRGGAGVYLRRGGGRAARQGADRSGAVRRVLQRDARLRPAALRAAGIPRAALRRLPHRRSRRGAGDGR